MESLLPTPLNRIVAISRCWHAGGITGFLTLLMIAAFVPVRTADAALIQTLHGFGTNPKNPRGGVVQANDGNFYGTTEFGGTNGENGTIFRITPNGVFTSLFSFNGANGSRPQAGLIQATDGHLYGTAAFGGTNGDNGTVFRITTSGVFSSLLSFRGTNGGSPQAALVQGVDGSLYGTTAFGGANADNGTIFRITLSGVFTPLFTLPSNGRSGIGPMGRLIQGSDGNFYGTTSAGGMVGDNGTVFRITPGGVFTSLFSFSGANGSGPAAGLVRGNDGNYYGTTQFGGTSDNGTVFRITPNGSLTSLYSFHGPDGNYPVAGLVLGSDGSFYGTTSGDRTFGGTNTFGTVFRITPGGALSTLSIFNGANGASPVATLSPGNDGNFYDTTFEGGPGSGGTIFRMVEPPFISAITAFNGIVTLTWSSFIKGTYRVEYKPSLNAPSWTALIPDVMATTNRTSFTNTVGIAAQRIYRVRLLP
jgi:uncharacterized repeat protein (TIGR03803 family)